MKINMLVHLMMLVSILHSFPCTQAKCPSVCTCDDTLTSIQCVDQVLFRLPELPKMVQHLNVSNIYLGPILTTSFNTFTRLTHLDLSSNLISFINNNTFSGLDTLTHLDLSNNNLKVLADDVFQGLHRLEVLHLDNNGIDNFNGAFFREMPNLRELYLSRNNFFHLKLGLRFQVLNQLQVLDLSHNDFADVTNDAFDNVHSWTNTVKRKLSLSHCQITSVENGTFLQFRGLYDLDLSGVTTLTSDNISIIMEDLKHLNTKRLNLGSMNLANIDTIFTSSPKLSLHYLNLSHNKLQNISATAFTNIGSLQHLDISYNNIKVLQPSFTKLNNLKILDISHNELKSFDGPAVAKLTSLETLTASHNRFDERSQVKLNPLQHLKVLDLSFNTLDDLITTGNTVKLEELILAGNNISSLDMIPQADNLRVLDVSQNKITVLGPYIFSSAVKLEKVDFSQNLISVIDHMVFLPNTSHPYMINLSGNKLTNLWFGGWSRAQVLDLSENLISEVDFNAFQGMSDLEVLDLSSNVITGFHDNTFRDLLNLHTLIVANNSLETHFHHQKFKYTFSSLESLKTVDLSSNSITHMEASTFDKNHALVNISLASNKLPTISPFVFKDLTNLQHLGLSGNPFLCDCNLLPLVSWLTEVDPDIYGKSRFECASPYSRRGMSIFEYEVTFLECNEGLLNFIVFGSLGLLMIFVGVVGTIVCRSYQKWRVMMISKTSEEKIKEDIKVNHVRKAKKEMPVEILDELDHHLKMKLWSSKHNGLSHVPNGVLKHGNTDVPQYHKVKKSQDRGRKVKKESSRSRSKSQDRKTSKSRSKSHNRSRSHSKTDKKAKEERERIRRYEKQLLYTLARYKPTSRWDSEGRDRWATLAHTDLGNRREYDPQRADKFFTMPSHRRQTLLDERQLHQPSHRRPQKTLLDDWELGRSEYSQINRQDRLVLSHRRPVKPRHYVHDETGTRRLPPSQGYDIVRAGLKDEEDRYYRRQSQRLLDKYNSEPYVTYMKDAKQQSEYQFQKHDFQTEPRSRGDKRGYDVMTLEKANAAAGLRQPQGTGREYVELPFRDTRARSTYEEIIITGPQRSKSYGDLDFHSKKRRFEHDIVDEEMERDRSLSQQRSDTHKAADVRLSAHHRSEPAISEVKAEVHQEDLRRTPEPDYPADNPKLSDWV
ncbi:CD180 antigen-like [Haliotis asinina]|uniref:CD180 antigen-like n=1 Tax=Haliotis asinina TaxID=109174 RepID=UPI0035319D5B